MYNAVLVSQTNGGQGSNHTVVPVAASVAVLDWGWGKGTGTPNFSHLPISFRGDILKAKTQP